MRCAVVTRCAVVKRYEEWIGGVVERCGIQGDLVPEDFAIGKGRFHVEVRLNDVNLDLAEPEMRLDY